VKDLMKIILRKSLILIIISVSTLLSADINTLRIEGKAQIVERDIIPTDILDKNMEQCALITFLTDLEVDIEFTPALGLARPVENPQPGRWEMYVSPGERRIRVNATGFIEFIVVLASHGIDKVRSGKSYSFDITGKQKITEIPVLITANQSGANVFIDKVLIGTIQDKLLTDNIESGEHVICIEKKGFASQKRIEVISRKNYAFKFVLEEALAAVLNITSNPAGASVTIDAGTYLPQSLERFVQIGKGKVTIRI
jgi:hypothetical protein